LLLSLLRQSLPVPSWLLSDATLLAWRAFLRSRPLLLRGLGFTVGSSPDCPLVARLVLSAI
jgi:hypothetical protein